MRLHGVAVGFILPTGPRVDVAVAVAEDLVASGSSGTATMEVAALRRDAPLSDVEPLLHSMLVEHAVMDLDREDFVIPHPGRQRASEPRRLPQLGQPVTPGSARETFLTSSWLAPSGSMHTSEIPSAVA